MTEVTLVYAADERMAMLLAASIVSAVLNFRTPDAALNVVVIDGGLSRNVGEPAVSCITRPGTVSLPRGGGPIHPHARHRSAPLRRCRALSAGVARRASECRRAIYLVPTPSSRTNWELWRGARLGAAGLDVSSHVASFWCMRGATVSACSLMIRISTPASRARSGSMAAGQHGQQVIDFQANSAHCPWLDQDALNAVFRGRWKPLDRAGTGIRPRSRSSSQQASFTTLALTESRAEPRDASLPACGSGTICRPPTGLSERVHASISDVRWLCRLVAHGGERGGQLLAPPVRRSRPARVALTAGPPPRRAAESSPRHSFTNAVIRSVAWHRRPRRPGYALTKPNAARPDLLKPCAMRSATVNGMRLMVRCIDSRSVQNASCMTPRGSKTSPAERVMGSGIDDGEPIRIRSCPSAADRRDAVVIEEPPLFAPRHCTMNTSVMSK